MHSPDEWMAGSPEIVHTDDGKASAPSTAFRIVSAQRDRSRVTEARVAGLAITLSVVALALVLLYVVGGYVDHVAVQIVNAAASIPTQTP